MSTGCLRACFIAAVLSSVCIALPSAAQYSAADDDRVLPFAEENEEGIEEEDDDTFAAMQTEVIMLGRVGGSASRLEDDVDDASFIQSEAKTISKAERSCESRFQVFDEEDDAVSLIQRDAAMHSPSEIRPSEDDDKSSLIQTDIAGQADKAKMVDRSKILAWDTILAMDVNTEKDEVKQMATTLQKEASVARSLTNEISDVNMLLVEPDEVANAATPRLRSQNGDDSTSLLQEDIKTKKNCKKKAKKNTNESPLTLMGDEMSFMQTTLTVSKGSRRVGRNSMPDDDDEEDLLGDDSASFMQASVNLEQGCSRMSSYMEDEDDEDDVFSL